MQVSEQCPCDHTGRLCSLEAHPQSPKNVIFDVPVDYGRLELNIDRILKERGTSKNQICKDLDIPRANFNRYCNNNFHRLDAGLICKLCHYLDIEVGELITYKRAD